MMLDRPVPKLSEIDPKLLIVIAGEKASRAPKAE